MTRTMMMGMIPTLMGSVVFTIATAITINLIFSLIG